jgi:hypothetical protein
VWRVEVGDGVGLITDQIVQAVGAVGVDEAVANPATSANALIPLAVYIDMTGPITQYLSLISQTTSKADSAPSSSTSPFCTASR